MFDSFVGLRPGRRGWMLGSQLLDKKVSGIEMLGTDVAQGGKEPRSLIPSTHECCPTVGNEEELVKHGKDSGRGLVDGAEDGFP